MGEPTPGPWRVGFEDGTGGAEEEAGAWIVGLDEEIVVAGGRHEGLKYGVTEGANARLIAAAPDLLAAAERAYAFFEILAERKRAETGGNDGAALDDLLEPEARLLRAAIDKARGSERRGRADDAARP